MATAYATPSVVLFGPMSPVRWGPPAERSQQRAIWHGPVVNRVTLPVPGFIPHCSRCSQPR
ncbi:hypothetical protein ACQP2E_03970 [Actinoplanes sp. CA-015351]|uniref:hypothetical protein n=1 Tax=Actinoplanes sp. CA-015351 TaxID=3239897 RepID=UPI003D98255E